VLATYAVNAPHVLSGLLPYSAPRSGEALSEPPPDELPRPASWFTGPIASYRAYAVDQLSGMEGQIANLEVALDANNRPAAEAAWRAGYVRYLRLGAVYLDGETAALEELATLNQEIDGNASGLQGGASSPRFRGLHRIEYGLWTGAPPRSLLGLARRLALDVRRLRTVLPHVPIAPLEIATRAHEILEDAQRDLLSGADVPWSGEGVLGTAAGLEATEEVVSALHGVIPRETHIVAAVDTELATLRSAIASIAAAHGGRVPANGQLTQHQAELLDGTLGGALEALSLVPGALETEKPPPIAQIPKSDVRIEP
jgi:high-affinity iron transporter